MSTTLGPTHIFLGDRSCPIIAHDLRPSFLDVLLRYVAVVVANHVDQRPFALSDESMPAFRREDGSEKPRDDVEAGCRVVGDVIHVDVEQKAVGHSMGKESRQNSKASSLISSASHLLLTSYCS